MPVSRSWPLRKKSHLKLVMQRAPAGHPREFGAFGKLKSHKDYQEECARQAIHRWEVVKPRKEARPHDIMQEYWDDIISHCNKETMTMAKLPKFDEVKAGLEASVARRKANAEDERKQLRARYARVLAQVDPVAQQSAMVLIGDGTMTDEEIIRACEVVARTAGRPASAPRSGTGLGSNPPPVIDAPLSKQELYEAGARAACEVLGKTAPTAFTQMFADSAPGFQIDESLYEKGAQMARQLKPFMESQQARKWSV